MVINKTICHFDKGEFLAVIVMITAFFLDLFASTGRFTCDPLFVANKIH